MESNLVCRFFWSSVGIRMRKVVCGLATLLLCSRVGGAEISYISSEQLFHQKLEGPGILLLSGDIVPGDYGRLLARIFFTSEDFFVTDEIILASDGGDVPEAIRIAKLLKSLYASVVVSPVTGRCVSACFLIYAAADERTSDDEGLIGIHRPYIVDSQLAALSPADAERAQKSVLKQARDYLESNNVPEYLIEEMFRRSSKDVYWLSADDLGRLGFQSPWFNQYLVAKCDWKGTMPFGVEEHRQEAFECRARVTTSAARQALNKAVFEYRKTVGPLPHGNP
jgi:hypothetical protein